MNPDLFITIAFCSFVALFTIGGVLVQHHERHKAKLDPAAGEQGPRSVVGDAGSLAGEAREAADDRAVDDVREDRRRWRLAAVVDQHEARRLE